MFQGFQSLSDVLHCLRSRSKSYCHLLRQVHIQRNITHASFSKDAICLNASTIIILNTIWVLKAARKGIY